MGGFFGVLFYITVFRGKSVCGVRCSTREQMVILSVLVRRLAIFPRQKIVDKIIKAVAVMSSHEMTQSSIWIGPRVFLSTVHMHKWPLNDEFLARLRPREEGGFDR